MNKKKVFNSKWIKIEDRTYDINGKEITGYLHVVRPDYVLIVALDNSGRLLLEKQYRRGVDDFTLECPAGWINENEDPLDACVRELFEETGYKGEPKFLGKLYVQPGYSSQLAHVFLVKLTSRDLSSSNTVSDEEIETILVNFDEINEMVKKGMIKDIGTLSALELYEKSLK